MKNNILSNSKEENELYLKAVDFAQSQHAAQTYSLLKLPYFYHLKKTEEVIDQFASEMPAEKIITLKISALLHDILEDTNVTIEMLKNEFGTEISDIISKVTKINEVNTADYEIAYYTQIAQNPLAVITKIADKCANTEHTIKNFSEWHAKRIIEGHEVFKNLAYPTIGCQGLKNYLDKLVSDLSEHA